MTTLEQGIREIVEDVVTKAVDKVFQERLLDILQTVSEKSEERIQAIVDNYLEANLTDQVDAYLDRELGEKIGGHVDVDEITSEVSDSVEKGVNDLVEAYLDEHLQSAISDAMVGMELRVTAG